MKSLNCLLHFLVLGASLQAAGETPWPRGSPTELHKAIFHGDVDEVLELLWSGLPVDLKLQSAGMSPLHVAAFWGEAEVALALVRAGAPVNALDSFDKTPLYWAVHQERPSAVEVLMKASANPGRGPVPNSSSPFLKAAELGFAEGLRIIIKESSNKRLLHLVDEHGLTALHLSAVQGDLETTTVLIKAGAPLNPKDGRGYTPLHHAVRCGVGRSVPHQNSWVRRDRELYWRGCREVTKILIEAGADLELVDRYGHSSQTYIDLWKNL